MTSTDTKPDIQAVKRPGALVLASVFTVGMLAALPLFLWYAQSRHGAEGAPAALLAFFVCWTSGLTALALSSVFTARQTALAGSLLAMLFRMGLPLAAIVTIQATSHPLLDVGADGMILVYYLLMLATEAPLSLLLVRPNPRPTGAA